MVQPRRHRGLASKPLEDARGGIAPPFEDLESDAARDSLVFREVDDALTATTEALDDPVRSHPVFARRLGVRWHLPRRTLVVQVGPRDDLRVCGELRQVRGHGAHRAAFLVAREGVHDVEVDPLCFRRGHGRTIMAWRAA